MRYLVIAGHPSSLNFAVGIDEQSEVDALARVSSIEQEQGYINAMFLIDLESKDIKRLYRSSDDEWGVSDTAFSRIGVETPDEWFEQQEQ